ncbi:MAG TPA: hypothetical protein VMV49_13530 [Candidatus Deferrimicrobium sp.]|nr:hypothetical protein [Candidatus Deferrimicrobium sp.]
MGSQRVGDLHGPPHPPALGGIIVIVQVFNEGGAPEVPVPLPVVVPRALKVEAGGGIRVEVDLLRGGNHPFVADRIRRQAAGEVQVRHDVGREGTSVETGEIVPAPIGVQVADRRPPRPI